MQSRLDGSFSIEQMGHDPPMDLVLSAWVLALEVVRTALVSASRGKEVFELFRATEKAGLGSALI